MLPSSLLVEPAYRTGPTYTRTLGPEVGELCDLIGFGPDAEQHAYSHPRPEHGSSVSDDSHCGGDLVGIGPFHKVSTRPRLHGGVVTVVRPWALVIENVPPSSSAR